MWSDAATRAPDNLLEDTRRGVQERWGVLQATL